MKKDSDLDKSNDKYINNIDSCQVVCSIESLSTDKSKKSSKDEIDKDKPKLISADEIASSYISARTNTSSLSKSPLINKSPLISELGHYAFSRRKQSNDSNSKENSLNKDLDTISKAE